MIEQWRQAFLTGAEVGLKKRGGDPLESELTQQIRGVLKDGPFVGAGHKKVTLRLRHRGATRPPTSASRNATA